MSSTKRVLTQVKPMTEDLRNKIQMYIKNGMDISDLIDGVSIKGENFCNAKIKRLVNIS